MRYNWRMSELRKINASYFKDKRVMVHPGADALAIRNHVVKDFNGHGRYVLTADLDSYPDNPDLLKMLIRTWEFSILNVFWDGSIRLIDVDHNTRDIVSVSVKSSKDSSKSPQK